MTKGHEYIIFTCAGCGRTSSACPECVPTVLIDPETQLPPDVEVVGGVVQQIVPSQEVVDRSEKFPVCDHCVEVRNRRSADKWETAEERHLRVH